MNYPFSLRWISPNVHPLSKISDNAGDCKKVACPEPFWFRARDTSAAVHLRKRDPSQADRPNEKYLLKIFHGI
ncbi:MAG TPA: hypothetical protein ACFYEA_10405 [Candidatus Tripitaka californicus]|uniref:hypothetical protein n=1 Tax=Candidatus Tripitaka californicus TaxID=3367616 RepID=UPI0040261180|nr:hypothetical protein [Planctomycetota bacterium]